MADVTHFWLRGYAVERLMSYIVGLMVYTAFVAVLGAVTVQFFVEKWQNVVVGHMVVEVQFAGSNAVQSDRERVVAQIRKILDSLRPVTKYRFILSSQVGVADLAPESFVEPVFVDVVVKSKELSPEGLQRSLISVHPALRVRGVSPENIRAARLVRLGEMGAFALLGLVVLGTLGVIAFAAQASLMINKRVVGIIFLMGATTVYVVRQFQRHMLKLAGVGAAIGGVAITLTLLAGFWFLRYNGYAEDFLYKPALLFLFIVGIPVAVVLFMVFSVDVSVRRALLSGEDEALDW